MAKKILLIEDDFSISELYKHVLEREGFEVVVSKDGNEGLNAASNNPDLILLDIMLPKMDGVQVLRMLKAQDNTKEIPVFLLTNLGDKNIMEKTLEIGAEKFLSKALIQPQDLPKELNEFFDKKAGASTQQAN
jgi:DNA-binding response OmpR family regulator